MVVPLLAVFVVALIIMWPILVDEVARRRRGK